MCEGYGIINFSNGDGYEGEFKKCKSNGYGIFYSSLGFKYEGYFKPTIPYKILYFFYKILLYVNYIYSKSLKNKMTILLFIILIIGILIN